MISAFRFIDSPWHQSERLIGEATQPQGAGKEDRRDAAIIKDKEVGAQGTELDRECPAALKMELSLGLVAQKVVSIAYPTLRPDGAGRVLGSLCDDTALFRDRQRAAGVAKPREKDG